MSEKIQLSVRDRIDDLCRGLQLEMEKYNNVEAFNRQKWAVKQQTTTGGAIYFEQKGNQLSLMILGDHIMVELTTGRNEDVNIKDMSHLPETKFKLAFAMDEDGIRLQQWFLKGQESIPLGRPLSTTTMASELFLALTGLNETGKRTALPLWRPTYMITKDNEALSEAGIVKVGKSVVDSRIDFTNRGEYVFDINEIKYPVKNVQEFMREKHLPIADVCYTPSFDEAKEMCER